MSELEIYKKALIQIHANAEDNFCAELAIEALNDGKRINAFKPGDKVTYKWMGDSDHGIVKSTADHGKVVFVVYNCDDDWFNYEQYTACSTSHEHLTKGWN